MLGWLAIGFAAWLAAVPPVLWHAVPACARRRGQRWDDRPAARDERIREIVGCAVFDATLIALLWPVTLPWLATRPSRSWWKAQLRRRADLNIPGFTERLPDLRASVFAPPGTALTPLLSRDEPAWSPGGTWQVPPTTLLVPPRQVNAADDGPWTVHCRRHGMTTPPGCWQCAQETAALDGARSRLLDLQRQFRQVASLPADDPSDAELRDLMLGWLNRELDAVEVTILTAEWHGSGQAIISAYGIPPAITGPAPHARSGPCECQNCRMWRT